jgi:hypothetical protein
VLRRGGGLLFNVVALPGASFVLTVFQVGAEERPHLGFTKFAKVVVLNSQY